MALPVAAKAAVAATTGGLLVDVSPVLEAAVVVAGVAVVVAAAAVPQAGHREQCLTAGQEVNIQAEELVQRHDLVTH